MTEPTTQDLMERINELETKLVKPEPPDMNQILRAEIDRVRSRNSFTSNASEVTDPAESVSVNTGADGGKGGVTKTPPSMNDFLRNEIRLARKYGNG